MLYVGSDSNIELLGLQTEDGSFLTAASISCVIKDSSGNTVATVSLTYLGTAVTTGGRTYADGNYRGVLLGSNSLTAGATYTLVYSCSNPIFSFTHYEVAQTRNA